MSRQKIGKMTTWKKKTTQEQSSAEGGRVISKHYVNKKNREINHMFVDSKLFANIDKMIIASHAQSVIL